jgi:hypothetical protein
VTHFEDVELAPTPKPSRVRIGAVFAHQGWYILKPPISIFGGKLYVTNASIIGNINLKIAGRSRDCVCLSPLEDRSFFPDLVPTSMPRSAMPNKSANAETAKVAGWGYPNTIILILRNNSLGARWRAWSSRQYHHSVHPKFCPVSR